MSSAPPRDGARGLGCDRQGLRFVGNEFKSEQLHPVAGQFWAGGGCPPDQFHPSLLPPSDLGLTHQTPNPIPGMRMADPVQDRIEAGRQATDDWQFLPAARPHLPSYLASIDGCGDTALRPGPLIPFVPLDTVVQGGKYWLAERGFRYSLQQSFTGIGMREVMQGSRSMGFYSLDLHAKWAVVKVPSPSTTGWISSQIEAKSGLGAVGATQSPKSNLGTLTEANYNWSSH